MGDPRSIEALVAGIDEQSSACGRRYKEFVDACLDLVRHRLPPVATHAHDIMKEYLLGSCDEAALMEARVDCWRYIDANFESKYSFDQPDLCGMRAVICGLYPETEIVGDDLVDALGTFLDFLHTLEPHYAEEVQLLNEKFPPK